MRATRPRSSAAAPETSDPTGPSVSSNGAPQQSTSYGGPERRRSTREPHFVTVTLQPVSGDASVDSHVLACDLSLGGVGFRSGYALKVGSEYRMTLGNGPLFLNARVKIVSCRHRRDGMYDVGAAFC